MKDKALYFFTRGLWLTLLICGIIICVLDWFLNFFVLEIDCFVSSLTIVGFVLTILVFFQGIARNTKFMKNVFKFKKDREFIFLCILSLIFSFVSCFISSIQFQYAQKFAFYALILAIIQLIGVTVSIIRIIQFNNKSLEIEDVE